MANRQHVLLTTSRRPTNNIRSLCRDLSNTFLNIVRINRGKLSLEGIAEEALRLGIEKVMIIDRWEKGLGKIGFFTVSQDYLENFLPIIYVSNARFRRDFEQRTPKRRRMESIAIAASSKKNFDVQKFENAMSNFFDIPVLSFEEASGKYDVVMQVLTDSSNGIGITYRLAPESIEVGPQLKIAHLVWE